MVSVSLLFKFFFFCQTNILDTFTLCAMERKCEVDYFCLIFLHDSIKTRESNPFFFQSFISLGRFWMLYGGNLSEYAQNVQRGAFAQNSAGFPEV